MMVWAAADDEASLKAQSRAEQRPDRRLRFQGRWLPRQGRPVDAVAAAVGVYRRRVERWIDWYRTRGLTGVLAHRQGGHGQPAKLTAAQQARVATEVETGRFRTAADIRAWVEHTFSVTYTEGGLYSLRARLRRAPKVPRPLHRKTDLDEPERFKGGASPRPWPRSG